MESRHRSNSIANQPVQGSHLMAKASFALIQLVVRTLVLKLFYTFVSNIGFYGPSTALYTAAKFNLRQAIFEANSIYSSLGGTFEVTTSKTVRPSCRIPAR
ncbi:MAG: hypothetical protein HKL80_05905 [Acidimicrobiales bacterium]|nr:hypothetical protein [Acidimicrobiales bacterium]